MPDQEKAQEKNYSILVIDDDETIRHLISAVLTDAGYNVSAVSNGEEALRKINEIPFEIVITDLKMQDMNGIEVLRKVKQVNAETDVIVITAYASLETALEAMRAGAYDYISKPFNPDEIIMIIDKIIKKKTTDSASDKLQHYRELSITDGLTRLYNHRYFHELLEREIIRARRYPQPVSMLMIDIDNFKIYNDAHGHVEGDNALKKVSEIMLDSLRKIDFVARYGGEEFSVILPETPKQGALTVARRLRTRFEKTIFYTKDKKEPKNLCISIGIATFPNDAQSKEGLIKAADKALYTAKELGKNRVCMFDNEKDA